MKTDSTKNTARRHQSPIATFARLVVAPTTHAEMLAPTGTPYADILASIPPRTPAKPAALAGNEGAHRGVDAATFVNTWAPPEWLFEGLIQRNQLVTLTAQPNHGKTSLAVYLALCLACGIPVAKHAAETPGRVLYLSGENDWDLKNRLLATMQRLGITAERLAPWLTIYTGSSDLAGLYKAIAPEANAHELGTSLVIIDTSSAYFMGVDENQNTQAQEHAHNARRFTQLKGNPAVLMLAHPTKNASRDELKPRGGGALYGAIDSSLTLWKDGDLVELHHDKMRGPSFAPLKFEFETLELAGKRDKHGRPVTEVTIRPIAQGDENQLRDARTREENSMILAMNKRRASIAEWAKDCELYDGNGNPAKMKAHRIIQRLEKQRIVERFRDDYRLTTSGKQEAQRLADQVDR